MTDSEVLAVSVDDEVVRQADDIAVQITKMLVEAFKAKEGRDPTAEEVEQLIEEITEERMEELLGGKVQPDDAEGDEQSEDEEGDEEEEENDEEDGDEEEGGSDVENQDVNNPFLALASATAPTPADDPQKETRNEGAEQEDTVEAKRRRISSD